MLLKGSGQGYSFVNLSLKLGFCPEFLTYLGVAWDIGVLMGRFIKFAPMAWNHSQGSFEGLRGAAPLGGHSQQGPFHLESSSVLCRLPQERSSMLNRVDLLVLTHSSCAPLKFSTISF